MDDTEQLNSIAAKVRDGEDITNAEARQILEAYAAADITTQAQVNLVNLLLQTIPELAFSLAGSVTQRCGRTEQKVKRSVGKIVEEQLGLYYKYIADVVAGNDKTE